MAKFNEYLEKIYNEIPLDIAPPTKEEKKIQLYRGQASEQATPIGSIPATSKYIEPSPEIGILYLKPEGVDELFANAVKKNIITQQGFDALKKEIPKDGIPFTNYVVEIDITGNSVTLHYRTIEELKKAKAAIAAKK